MHVNGRSTGDCHAEGMSSSDVESRDVIHAHCASCFTNICHYNGPAAFCSVTPCDVKCGAVFHACKRSAHRDLCPLEKVTCLNANNGCSATLCRRDVARHLSQCPASVVYCGMEWFRKYERCSDERQPRADSGEQPDVVVGATGVVSNEFDLSNLLASCPDDGSDSLSRSSPLRWLSLNFIPLSLNEVLSGELDSISAGKTETNQSTICNVFICGQMFRRDSYAIHARVHCDIYGSYPEWLEHRCPLEQYGCKFSTVRVRPDRNSLVYSHLLESFGLERETPTRLGPLHRSSNVRSENSGSEHGADLKKSDISGIHSGMELTPSELEPEVEIAEPASRDGGNWSPFSCLPTELIMRIASYLDSFSLCNMSLTCWPLRDVCRGLLQRRGIVVQKWKKATGENGQNKWQPCERCWMFSTVCDPIERWEYVDQSPMLRHVMECPFNEKCELPESNVELPVRGINLQDVKRTSRR